MSEPSDRLDALLGDYERRKQEETRELVQRALALEEARRKGAEQLRLHAVEAARDVAERLRRAGHEVVYQEMLDAYPPGIRMHLWPRRGPLDRGDATRESFELVWGDPQEDHLCARRWGSRGLDRMQLLGSARAGVVDDVWVREQLVAFVREALQGA